MEILLLVAKPLSIVLMSVCISVSILMYLYLYILYLLPSPSQCVYSFSRQLLIQQPLVLINHFSITLNCWCSPLFLSFWSYVKNKNLIQLHVKITFVITIWYLFKVEPTNNRSLFLSVYCQYINMLLGYIQPTVSVFKAVYVQPCFRPI